MTIFYRTLKRAVPIKKFFGISLFILLSLSCSVYAISQRSSVNIYDSIEYQFQVVKVGENISRPWGIAVLPDNRLLITERNGRLFLLQDEQLTEVDGVPEVVTRGQGGLLDIEIHPQFDTNRLVFFSYSYEDEKKYGTAIGRAELVGTTLRNLRTIFRMDNPTSTTLHFGSRIAFLPDETLLFTIGDRGSRNRAQDIGDHAGSVLRIDIDGRAPADNPFVSRAGARAEIFSFGHRNPQGLAVDSHTGIIWQHEHGPKGGDELNIIEAGNNYGWPIATYGREYGGNAQIGAASVSGTVQPIEYWVPTSIAPSGMMIYRGEEFERWQGDIFIGTLAGKHLRRLHVEGRKVVAQEILLENEIGRIRDIAAGQKGNIWLITDENRGGVYRLERIEN